jgi:transketolase
MTERPSEQLAAIVRRHIVRMTHLSRGSHVASSLSIADILAVLYTDVLRVRPDDPEWDGRDRFILSKGHASAALYAVLAERGFFPVEELDRHCADGAMLCGHVTRTVPGVEFSTGSLGHGLPVGAGMALALSWRRSPARVFVLLSDGECDEGSNWEAALFAAHRKLENLTAIIDYNKIQSLDTVERTLRLEPLADKWRAFGWQVTEVDGHDHSRLRAVLAGADGKREAPMCVIAHTVKGKGVSFMENSVLWHYRSPQGAEYERAMRELGA